MRDFKLNVIIDQGPNARSVRLNLPKFTLVGTTARKEALTPDLLSCFPIVEKLEDYTAKDLAAVAHRFAKGLEVKVDDSAAESIADSADDSPGCPESPATRPRLRTH